ncbi:hypothetical protein B7C42_05508 [Nocardia cerradoensis]|uniref:Uncharacterized protein n=1 Tax=Nocardia cerradoensis TaxID=85688 RepID=A0A231H0C8_9NOCA|nr:hypothetical protein [Nocardia cerradoensis]OXR42309.1 hypothetical protein B7C42_05508 [Nocardia cerradoensis]
MAGFSRTNLGRQRTEWDLRDGQVTVLGFVDGERDGIDMTRFGEVTALWCEPGGVAFPGGLLLGHVRAMLPEYHSLWCAVSEQARVLALDQFTPHVTRVLRAMADGSEWWSERLCQEHEFSRRGSTRSLNWLCRHGYIEGAGRAVDTGRYDHEPVYRITEAGRCIFRMLSESPAEFRALATES